MRGQRGQLGIVLVVTLVVIVLAFIGLFSVCTRDDDRSMGVTPAAYHEDCDWSGDCGDDRYRQDYGSRDDRNRNRNRNRGSFSPGPFDRSPVDVHDNTVCFPFASCGRRDGDGRMGGDDQPAPGDGA